jgi:predicted secreted protein
LAKFVATDYKVTINGGTVSSSLASVELPIEIDEQETTAFGSEWRTRIAGLKSGSITLEFHQDFAAGALDSILWPLLGTNATVVVVPTSGTVNSSNPSYSGTFLVTQYTPYASTVGDLATVSVSWPLTGALTRATA